LKPSKRLIAPVLETSSLTLTSECHAVGHGLITLDNSLTSHGNAGFPFRA
jgi:hypothetical protein